MIAVSDIDWDTWTPHDVATLMFVIRGGEVLLIRKLRGLGAGKINAPGGRLEPGEEAIDAAIRETREEVGVTPIGPRYRGRLRFSFVKRPAELGAPHGGSAGDVEAHGDIGYRLECHVFSADGCEGETTTTDEAIPMWVPLAKIPYDEMWADDRLWLPLMLSGRTPFEGRFVFEGEAMLDVVLESHDPAAPLFAALDTMGLAHITHPHPPVFTVEEAQRHRPAGAVGLHTKNLFVRNKKGRMFLVTLEEERPVDLKALGIQLEAGNLSFASYHRLRTHLGVEPGSVTPLSVINDRDGQVTLVLDRALALADQVWCHPLTNDRATGLSGAELVRFATAHGHPPVVIDLG